MVEIGGISVVELDGEGHELSALDSDCEGCGVACLVHITVDVRVYHGEFPADARTGL